MCHAVDTLRGVLCQRNFGLLWVGQNISMVGDWILFVALPFYIYTLTGSTLATGIMFIVQTLPRLFFGSLAGVAHGYAPYQGRILGTLSTVQAIALLVGPLAWAHREIP